MKSRSGGGSAIDQLRDLAALLPRDGQPERRLLAIVIREARTRLRSGDNAFAEAISSALLVQAAAWARRDVQVAADLRASLTHAADGVARYYDQEVGPQVERAILAELKQRRASEAGAAAKKAKAAEMREKLLRGETVHRSPRTKSRYKTGK